MKPCMKFCGSLALGSSSALKYFSTCVSCFQKFKVSCGPQSVPHVLVSSAAALVWQNAPETRHDY